MQEVLRYLAEEGLMHREGGQWQRAAALEEHIPEGLRDVIGKRRGHVAVRSHRDDHRQLGVPPHDDVHRVKRPDLVLEVGRRRLAWRGRIRGAAGHP